MSASNDLYAGLAVPTRTKRNVSSRSGATDVSKDNANGHCDDRSAADLEQDRAVKRPKTAALDLPATIAKLKGYMLVDKKFPKASKLFAQLIAECMDAQSRHLFVDALRDITNAKGARWSGTPELEALVQQFVATYESLPAPAVDTATYSDHAQRRTTAELVEDWKLMALTHAQLFTDETYQFVKAAKVVKARLEQVPAGSSVRTVGDADKADGNDDDDGERSTSASTSTDSNSATTRELVMLMPLLRTLFGKHTTAWARATVESVLALATQRRLRFCDAHRTEVDAWTAAIQSRRAAPVVARTAASDARRNILAASDSEATVRVGRSNHPLFNKQ